MQSYDTQLITMFPNLPSSSDMTHDASTANNSITPANNHTAGELLLPFSLRLETEASGMSASTDSGGGGKSRAAEMDSAGTCGDGGVSKVSKTKAPAVGKVGKKIKKQKYAFQTRSPVDILDDGFRWRKYGQKAVKNSKFPRSYYKCANEGCNVKKQVQRLSKDEAVVVTTYEGVHTHSDSDTDKCTDNFEQILTQMQIYNP